MRKENGGGIGCGMGEEGDVGREAMAWGRRRASSALPPTPARSERGEGAGGGTRDEGEGAVVWEWRWRERLGRSG